LTNKEFEIDLFPGTVSFFRRANGVGELSKRASRKKDTGRERGPFMRQLGESVTANGLSSRDAG
jgi:hypothetical protein